MTTKFEKVLWFSILVSCFTVYVLAEITESSLSPLKCFCDVCSDTNFTCHTNGACFIARETLNGSFRISQRCYNDEKTSHYEFPSICSKFYDDKFSVKCCSSDFCNTEEVLPPRQVVANETFVDKPKLKCHCSHCSRAQFSCETDGLCFLSWKKTNGELVYSQNCYDKKFFFPPDAPTFCELRPYDDYGRVCCEKNYCNVKAFKEEVKFNAFALIFLIAFLLSAAFVIYQNWN